MAYLIKSGDTLGNIAAQNNTTVANLMSLNPNITDANKIQAGASLNLSPTSSFTAPQQQAYDYAKSLAITPTSLTQNQSPIVPTTPTTPTTPNVGGMGTTITANAANLSAPATDTSTEPDWLKQLLQPTTSPTANADLYTSTYGVTSEQAQADRNTAQTDANTANAAYQAATDKYNALNAQIQGLDYQQNTVIPEQQQGTATGELGRQIAIRDNAHNILLQKAPLQYEALLAQVDQANALGKANLAAGILKQANDHLDALFTAKSADVKSAVDTQNKNFTAIYNYLNTKEQNQVAEMKATTASNNTQANNFINDVQAAITSARESGSPELSGAIAKLLATTTLDPTSKTFAQDYQNANAALAKLTGQLKPKPVKETNPTGVTPVPGAITLGSTEKQELIGAGFTVQDIVNIQNDVNEHGIDAVLSGITSKAQKDAIQKVYGGKQQVTREQLNTTVTSKVAYDGMKDAYTNDELKKFADDAGISSFWTSASSDIERYLNSSEAKQKYIDLLYEQYKSAGMAI